MTAALEIIAPGMRTTLQDLGRTGYQKLGVPTAGALDPVSLRIANLLVGNRPGEAALEISYLGPTIEVMAASVRIALAGSAIGVDVTRDGESWRVPSCQSVRLRQGDQLRVGGFGDTTVAYLAVEHGFDIAPVLGSLSTLIMATLGGFHGRALRAGDMLPLRRDTADARDEVRLSPPARPRPARFRVVLGPQHDLFTPAQIGTFLSATYKVAQTSDRMGMRLEGPALDHTISLISDGSAPGAIQVPGNGLPIVLLADRGTTGGYPKIATVVSADLAALGRLLPGAPIGFEAVSVADAEAARRTLEASIIALRSQLQPVRDGGAVALDALFSHNLISGVVSADT